MDASDHLGSLTPHAPELAVHEHLLSVCPECREAWRDLGPVLQNVIRRQLANLPPEAVPRGEPDADDLSAASESLMALHDRVTGLRRLRRQAKKELSELRTASPAHRPSKVDRAYRRFRSRVLAELLLAESRAVLADSPAEAASFASLVPLTLAWARGPRAREWAAPLLARAAAIEANALRVDGDVAATDRCFTNLRRFVVESALSDSATHGELATFEAAFRIDQGRPDQAEHLLERAVLAYDHAGDVRGLAMAEILLARLLASRRRPDEVLRLLDGPAFELPADLDARLVVGAIAARVDALCALGRPVEARDLLRRHLDAFEAGDCPSTAARLRRLQGRIALTSGELDEAEELFRSAMDGMLVAGRPHDAARAALDLAETLLARSDPATSLAQVAGRLVSDYRQSDVDGDALAVLKLLAQASSAGKLTPTVLARLHRKLDDSEPTGVPYFP